MRPSALLAAAFELGNLAATLLILRATELLTPGRSHSSATQLALVLYTGYNLAATLASIPPATPGDRRGMLSVLAAGAACFLSAYIRLSVSGESFALQAGCLEASDAAGGASNHAAGQAGRSLVGWREAGRAR